MFANPFAATTNPPRARVSSLETVGASRVDPPSCNTAPTFRTVRKQANPSNRRASIRYTAAKEHIWLGWWNEGEFRIVEAKLINISEGGVLVGVSSAPAQGQPVWLRQEGNNNPPSLHAVVLDAKWTKPKRFFAVRLAFRAECPTDFFESAIVARV